MSLYFWIAIGSALGGVARHALNGLAESQLGSSFPWGILIINVTGSFAIGFIYTLSGPDGRWVLSSESRQFLMVGICGGYTTFSSFSLRTLLMMREGALMRAGANIALSVVLCLVAAWLGQVAAAAINASKGS